MDQEGGGPDTEGQQQPDEGLSQREQQAQNIRKSDNSPSESKRNDHESLEALQRWPTSRLWPLLHVTGASQISLPLSVASSTGLPSAPADTKDSLEQLTIEPANIPLPNSDVNLITPATKKPKQPSALQSWFGGAAATKSKKRSKKKAAAQPPPHENSERFKYRSNINALAINLPNFKNVSHERTRVEWSGRLVFFDRHDGSEEHTPKLQEPWKYQLSLPPYDNFHNTLKKVPDNVSERVILIEDLDPALIDHVGTTFQIPPHVFEEHLDRSGYTGFSETRKAADLWNTRSSAPGYSSITWYRPVLPLLHMSPRFRAKLLDGLRPKTKCFKENCYNHYLELATVTNIWRRHLKLSPIPDILEKSEDPAYPIGWEERATIWSTDYDGCRFGTHKSS
jgi:hypothetical protein